MSTELQDSIPASQYVNTGEHISPAERSEDVPVRSNDGGAAPLFPSQEAGDLRDRWQKIQVGFVDEPRNSVEQADRLVATVTQRLNEMFQDQKNRLEHEWDKGEVSTEALRTAFQRYRALFDRLLAI